MNDLPTMDLQQLSRQTLLQPIEKPVDALRRMHDFHHRTLAGVRRLTSDLVIESFREAGDANGQGSDNIVAVGDAPSRSVQSGANYLEKTLCIPCMCLAELRLMTRKWRSVIPTRCAN
jgi:hypothetical protein